MAGIKKKKGEAGEVKKYITRNAAVKKLQLSLRDFRRICILKGIYPREPRHRKRVQKGDSKIKTLYFLKDIQFLLHEPIIWNFREHRAFMRKMRKAWSRNDKQKSRKLCTQKPFYKLDHIVRERYPTFVNALRDLDDPLTLCFLFSKLPAIHRTPLATIEMCRRLTIEFMHYVIEANALRKVFISIKGYYYQVEIMGQLITWIAPHPFAPRNDTHIDFKIMKIFAEFYITLLGFVNFRLYHSLNIHYPPKLQDMVKSKGKKNRNEIISEHVASLNAPLLRNKVDDDDEEDGIDTHLLDEDTDQLQAAREEALKKKKQQCLFKGLKFFLNRETNLESLTFVIRACQGQVSWDESTAEGSTYPVTDESITHEIVDRPQKTQKYLSRYYIQPQWVYDCINARILLPVQEYFPGVTLPAHLSPFTLETATTTALYVPPEKKKLEALQKGDLPLDQLQDVEDSEDEDSEDEEIKESETTVEENKDKKCDVELEEIEEVKEAVQNPSIEKMAVHEGSEVIVKKSEKNRREKEETRLSVMMIPRKQKRLYRILRTKERKEAEKVVRLTNKRKIIDEKEKQKKKKSRTIENSQKRSVVKI
ncbi:pescadillo homolog [Cherax quadricarinatus]